jgi:hypothetical protein
MVSIVTDEANESSDKAFVPWTAEEEEILRERYSNESTEILANELNRTIAAIDHKAIRLGLRKSRSVQAQIEEGGSTDVYLNQFILKSREDAIRLDRIDLLRYNWSLLEMYQRELEKPGLSQNTRHRMMSALGQLTGTIANVMRGREDELGDEEDLRDKFSKFSGKNRVNKPE